ncbi:MAG: BMC domain-containing protein [Mailhella sp.]|nr:BMC domain-containing protein [Mailhella sp.]
MLALGLVETYGLVGAIEAADVMLKSADVTLLERNGADAGLVTITVAGEVSAVQASVQAAAERVKHIGGTVLISAHVIPRPDLELEKILLLEPGAPFDPGTPPVPKDPEPGPDKNEETSGEAAPEQKATVTAPMTSESRAQMPAEPVQVSPSITPARLKNMSLAKLRQTARDMEGLDLSEEAITAADRRTLIAALTQALRNIEE